MNAKFHISSITCHVGFCLFYLLATGLSARNIDRGVFSEVRLKEARRLVAAEPGKLDHLVALDQADIGCGRAGQHSCHRVVAAGSLGGYSSPNGLEMKRRLLAREGSLARLANKK